LAEDSRTAEELSLRNLEALEMRGMMKGARRESTKRVTRSVMVSISFSRPGTLEMMAEMLRTTLSRNSRIG
jgi:hypothetical protein